MEFSYISFSTVFSFLVLICRSQLITDSMYNDLLEQKYGEIQHVSVIFRHGDRNPEGAYPLDPYRNYVWPGGSEELSMKGKKRIYDLGQWFKKRYSKLTGEEYDRERILVQSSDKDTTIMSALLFLHALYPANGSQVWLENEKWQPIPVHTIPLEYDSIIFNDKQHCPRWQKARQLCHNLAQTTEIYDEYNETITFIKNHTGLNFSTENYAEMKDELDFLRDTLFIEVQNNKTLPHWTDHISSEPLQTIVKKLKWKSGLIHKKDIKRFACGPILKSLTSDMVKKLENPDFSQKVHIYSGHDCTIFRVLYALDAYSYDLEKIFPPYGAILILELRRNVSDDYHVTISYKSTSYESAVLLKIPACGESCTFEQFIQITKPLIPGDWNKECQLGSGSVKMSLSWCSVIIAILMYILR